MATGTSYRQLGTLPPQTSGFVGREAEVAQVRGLLRQSRLVTIAGPGGVGKTRLAVRVAEGVTGYFTGGVHFIELSAVRDPGLLVHTLAAGLELAGLASPEPDQASQLDRLLDFIRGRRLLLILDTCEHLVDGCAELADTILRAAPGITILATSRQPLDAAGEATFQLSPFPVPDPGSDLAGKADAVELFAQRAAAVLPGFTVTRENLADIIAVCRRLDGIPLAIELATVRLRALPLHQMAVRIDDRLRLLTGGRRSGTPRHQTLRAAIEWSYSLCTPAEQLLWARLSVFADGFDLAAAEEVCAGAGLARDEIVPAVISLVDKNVLTRGDTRDPGQPGDGRPAALPFRMPDTLREFGAERLHLADLEPPGPQPASAADQHPDSSADQRPGGQPTASQRTQGQLTQGQLTEGRHMGGEAAVGGRAADPADRLPSLVATGRRRDAAARRAEAARQAEAAGHAEAAVRRRFVAYYLALAELFESAPATDQLARYQRLRSEHANLRAAFDYALELPGNDGARVVLATSLFVYWRISGQLREAEYWLDQVAGRCPERSAPLARVLGTRGYIRALLGDFPSGQADAETAVALAATFGDVAVGGRGYSALHRALAFSGSLDEAQEASRSAAACLTSAGDVLGLAQLDVVDAMVHLQSGDPGGCCRSASRGLGRITDDELWCAAQLHGMLALGLFLQGDIDGAQTPARQALEMQHLVGDVMGVAFSLGTLAFIAAGERRYQRTAWLLGASAPLWERTGRWYTGSPAFESLHQVAERVALTSLGDDEFWRLRAAGAAAPLDHAVTRALSDADFADQPS
jgi:predicted ATPase